MTISSNFNQKQLDENGQLSLDLCDDLILKTGLAAKHRKEAIALLAELARSLGELKAEMDLANFCENLVDPVEQT